MTIQWKNNLHIGKKWYKITNMKYNKQLGCITYTNISMKTLLYDAQTY